MGIHDKRPSIKEPFDFSQTFITAKWDSWQRVPTLILGLRVKWNFWRRVRHHSLRWLLTRSSLQCVPTSISGLRLKWNLWWRMRHHFVAMNVNIGVMKVLTKLWSVLREALSKMVTLWFATSVRVFDPRHFSNEALSQIRTLGFCCWSLGFLFYEKLYAKCTLLGFLS